MKEETVEIEEYYRNGQLIYRKANGQDITPSAEIIRNADVFIFKSTMTKEEAEKIWGKPL